MYFGWDSEVRHVAYLAQHAELRVSIKTSPVMTRTTDPNDPPGWATLTNPLDSLSVTDSVGHGYAVDFASEFMQFKFVPHSPDSTSPTDTTWKIVRWTELRQPIP